MSLGEMMTNEIMVFWYKHNHVIKLALAMLVVGVLLSACAEPKPRMDSGEIIQIVKHDDVDVKKCAKEKKESKKVNGTTRVKYVCVKWKEVEVSPETYEFELRSGNKTGWTDQLDEETGESYQVGDQYP